MAREELGVCCEGLLFRVFHLSRVRDDGGGTVVALTSPQEGAGVSQITYALADALRRDGSQPAISLCADQLGLGDPRHSTQTKFSNALAEIRREYRYALIDCGSMKAAQYAVRLAPLVDGIILVLEANRTQAEQLHYAERTLESVNGRILGHVLNKRTYVVPNWFHRAMGAVGI
jgi:Mrp family chromosome partitioning ATPase